MKPKSTSQPYNEVIALFREFIIFSKKAKTQDTQLYVERSLKQFRGLFVQLSENATREQKKEIEKMMQQLSKIDTMTSKSVTKKGARPIYKVQSQDCSEEIYIRSGHMNF